MDILILAAVHLASAALLGVIALAAAITCLFCNRTRGAGWVTITTCELVLADRLFMALAVAVQPIIGLGLAEAEGLPFTTPWIAASAVLCGLTWLCWIPAGWLKVRLLEMALEALREGAGVSPCYGRYFRAWSAVCFTAAASPLAAAVLMVVRPNL